MKKLTREQIIVELNKQKAAYIQDEKMAWNNCKLTKKGHEYLSQHDKHALNERHLWIKLLERKLAAAIASSQAVQKVA